MKTLTIELPDEVDEKEAKMTVASALFDKGILSSGQAAKFVGISKREFLETVGQYGVSIFGETGEDCNWIDGRFSYFRYQLFNCPRQN